MIIRDGLFRPQLVQSVLKCVKAARFEDAAREIVPYRRYSMKKGVGLHTPDSVFWHCHLALGTETELPYRFIPTHAKSSCSDSDGFAFCYAFLIIFLQNFDDFSLLISVAVSWIRIFDFHHFEYLLKEFKNTFLIILIISQKPRKVIFWHMSHKIASSKGELWCDIAEIAMNMF